MRQDISVEMARTFLEIVACGSFAEAAEVLLVTRSTVTMRIKALEEKFGRKLLTRTKSGVTMTAAGASFYRYAESMVRSWQLARQEIALPSGFRGVLSIGAESDLWDNLLYGWLCEMRVTRPDIALRIEADNPETLLRRLFQGWIDICVVHTIHSRVGFRFEPLFNERLVLVSTEKRGVVHWDPNTVFIDWGDSFRAQAENHYQVDYTAPLTVTLGWLGIRYVTTYGGATYIPEHILKTQSFERPLYRVEGAPVFDRMAYIAYPENSFEDRRLELSIEDIRRSMRERFEAAAGVEEPAAPSGG